MAFDVTAVLKANVSNFTSGIKEAQSVFESFQSKSNRTFENVANGFQMAGLALSAGLTAPVLAGIGAVVKGYASLEQNLGGTEAVFGQFAKSVQNDAKSAYQTMGLSASDYMATANKMGSLFQGSGVDQQKSLDMTSKAMKRAADVASVMGVDTSMAMESIAGAAKGNFTMMDNLGVAMNATTLEAYALEKGLNFKWDTASNVEKAELAMQMFMDRTKQYDGNFLKESEKTVAGSLDAMKGAFSNFVAGLGNPEADVAQLMTNLKTTIVNFSKNIKGVIKTIWDNLPLAPWQKWVGLIAVGAGPVLLALSGIMKGIGTLKAAFQGIGAVLTNPWGLALVALVALVAGFVHAYQNSEKFRNIVNSAVSAVIDKFNELKAKVQPTLDFIKNALGKFNVGTFAPLIGGIGLFIASLIKLKGIKIPNPFSKFKPSFPKIPNPFAGLANMAKSAGSAVKNAFSGLGKAIGTAFKGIGTAISTVFQGIARAISMLNPAGIASFAVGLAAVTAALVALSAVQGMVLPFLQGLADIFVKLVGGTLQAFASALVTLAPIMTTIAQAFAMLSPLVVAFGVAFSMVATAVGGAIAKIITAITPIVAIISSALLRIVTVITNAVVQIVQAIAPFIPNITQMFTTIATVVANAIVQIVQALAPFIPAVTQMVVALAPVLSQIVSAFNNLISQISPIIDSITNLFRTLGEQISSILESAGSVVESFGSAIRNVLDGVAGIFESMGNAAKNAGQGVKLMAQGIKMLVDLKLGDLVGTLAAVAVGLTAIVSSGIGSAGPGLQAAGMGMQMMATSAQMASVAIQMLPTALATLSASLGTLPAMMNMAGSAMVTFATSAQSSMMSLMAIGTIIAQFASMLIAIGSSTAVASAGLATFNGQANAAGSAMQRLSSASSSTLGQVTALGAGIMSSMANATASISNAGAQMTTTLRSSGTQMVTITQSTMNQMKSAVLNGMTAIVSAVRNGGSQMVSAWQSAGQQMVSSTQNTVNKMNSSLRNVGSGVNLYSNGTALMAGLKSGIDAGWSQITASVSSMAEWIKQNKGPVSYDKRLLVDNGLAIMFGLNRGISSGWQEVKSNVSSMAGQLSELVQTGLDGSFDLPNMAANLMNSVTVSHNPQSVQHSIDNVASQQRLIKKFDELIDEVRRSGNTYLDGKVISRKVDHNLGQNTQLRSRTSWAT